MMPFSPQAQPYAQVIRRAMQVAPIVLTQHKLLPAFKNWVFSTDPQGLSVLFGVLDDDRIAAQTKHPLRAYLAGDVLHDLATLMDGVRVLPSNSNGVRYAFILSEGQLHQMPPHLPFPGLRRGELRLGETYGGREVALPLAEVGHLLVAGMPGSGKSLFDRLVVYQAMAAGYQLAIVDTEQTTFPMLLQNPALIAPLAQNLAQATEVLEAVRAEMQRRKQLFAQVSGYPEKLTEYNQAAATAGLPALPPLLVVLEEYNHLVTNTGGLSGSVARLAADLADVGRKWGITMLLSGQRFHRRATGLIGDACRTRLCFRVEQGSTSRIVVGDDSAARLPNIPGRAMVRSPHFNGRVQTYLLEKDTFVERTAATAPPLHPPLTASEKQIVATALQRGGLLNREVLKEALNVGMRTADRLLQIWDERGWAKVDPHRSNGRYLTPAVLQLFRALPVPLAPKTD